jgi:Ca2+-binding RTX toxin-like protein
LNDKVRGLLGIQFMTALLTIIISLSIGPIDNLAFAINPFIASKNLCTDDDDVSESLDDDCNNSSPGAMNSKSGAKTKTNKIMGTEGNDFLVGDSEPNIIRGLGGDDQIHGGPFEDWIYGQKGEDFVVGNEGTDVINGGRGIDTLNGGPGNDQIQGGPLDDFVTGADGDDTLMGGSGSDSIFAGPGNDDLTGGPGDDFMGGGPGADSFDCGKGVDQISDFNESEGDTKSEDC